MKKILVLILLLGSLGCAQTKNTNMKLKTNNTIYWVNSSKVPCQGVGEMQCFEIQKGDFLQPNKWELFYNEISGFTYEKGYLYKIEVKEEPLPINEVPADAPSIKYTLVKIISKEKVKHNNLHDLWALETLNGKTIQIKGNRPQIEFNLNENKIWGSDGCNSIFSIIKNLDENTLELGTFGSTKKACFEDVDLSRAYVKNLETTASYKIKGLQLYLYNAKGKEILGFKKVD